MRLWLKDSERRPDPAPLATDDRKAMLVGLAAWVVALILVLFFFGAASDAGNGWWLWTCVAGIIIGVLGLIYTQARRKRGH